jgi:glutamate racemase
MPNPSTISAPTILVFDSGLGGLSVHAELVKAIPDARYIYGADDAAFPYGNLPPDILNSRVNQVMAELIAWFQPDLVVVACNTASTICLPSLRKTFALPFVGTVPAVKPAAALSRTKTLSILGTPGTVSRDYTHDLIIQHAADCRVTLVGAPNLAGLVEAYLRGEAVSDAAVLAEILPCFREKEGLRTDTIALACTHYPLLIEAYRRVAPWPVDWVDPAPAIARRVASLIAGTSNYSVEGQQKHIGKACFTSGKTVTPVLAKALERRGLASITALILPFKAVSG